MKLLSDFDLGWLIGIIDGEGCFSIKRSNRYQGIFTLSNTNLKIINKFSYLLSKQGIHHSINLKQHYSCNGKDYYHLDIKSLGDLLNFLNLIINSMDCRKEQAQILKSFVNRRLSRPSNEKHGEVEERFYLQLRELNKRGKVDYAS